MSGTEQIPKRKSHDIGDGEELVPFEGKPKDKDGGRPL